MTTNGAAELTTEGDPPTYRVVAPLIQLLGHPRSGRSDAFERTLRQGDILPAWVADDEVARLLAIDFIEAAS